METLVEILSTIAQLLFLAVTIFYLQQLEQKKKKRALSTMEKIIRWVAMLGIIMLAINVVIERFFI